jgi:hypothetical protein
LARAALLLLRSSAQAEIVSKLQCWSEQEAALLTAQKNSEREMTKAMQVR